MKHIVIGFFIVVMLLFQPKVEAYDYKDCEIFVLPYMSHSHYLECLKDPNNYSNYFVYYTVNFYSDSTLLRSQSIRRGSNASAPVQPTKVGHTFTGWDRGFSNVQSNLTVNATWMKSQQVTFIDYNGTVLKTQFVQVGESATPPNVTARTGYEFAGWNGTYTNVTQDTTVQATYQPIVYTVTFLDLQGRVLRVDHVNYNGSVTPPTAPLIEGKTFTQWSTSTNHIKSSMSVSPQYSTAIYQVRFYEGENLLKTTNVEHGQNAVAPPMTKEGHDFQGWNPPVNDVKASIDTQAVWQVKHYDVYFYNENNELISHQQIAYLEAATAPLYDAPIGQELESWDTNYYQVTEELHVHPVLTTKKVYVYYMDGDTLLHQETLEYGMSCVGFTPIKTGHDFTQWSEECNTVTNDMTLQANFTPHTFVVRFMDFAGELLKEEIVQYQQPATPPSTEFPNYRFDGWNTSFDQVTSDVVIRPLGEMRTYRAVFKNHEGTTLCEFNVKYEEQVECSPPERSGFEFTGWSDSLVITKDITLLPEYQPLQYNVDFYVDDVLVKREQVRHNYPASPPSVNLEAHDLTGWSVDVKNITSNLRVDALLESKSYVVVFKIDSETIKEQVVEHGMDATPPTLVIKPGHTFVGWIDDYKNVTTHRAIQSRFEINQYQVRFLVEGNVTDVQQVEYLREATPPLVEVEGYDFMGWRGSMTNITQDTDIHAILRAQTFTVTFAHEDQVISEQQVTYGEDATLPDDGPWDQAHTNITKDMYIQRSTKQEVPVDVLQPEEVEITEASPTTKTINAVIEQRSNRWRYNFEIDLQEYELRGIDGSMTPVTFQPTTFFRDESTWLEIESDDVLDFELVHLNTQEVFTVDLIETTSSNSFIITQLWQQLLSFITGMFN